MQIADEIVGDLGCVMISQLGGANVFGSLTFRALADGVGHSLTFAELIESNAVEIRHVEKNVSAVVRGDEPETLVRHLLDRAFSHTSHLLHRNSV